MLIVLLVIVLLIFFREEMENATNTHHPKQDVLLIANHCSIVCMNEIEPLM